MVAMQQKKERKSITFVPNFTQKSLLTRYIAYLDQNQPKYNLTTFFNQPLK